ncbi:type II toxin-antitoxin system VapC family toxin [Micromonospora purpureochromogenes]|uniref:type II toxin-antitoxin system VapC family toxin n=1 Tax=Micromonospora purpureochromogenes TaxID=47872 RepID=UPI0033DCBD11
MRPENPSSVYLDSNTLIYAMTKRPGYEPVAEVLRLAEAKKLEVIISDLSYVEVRGWPNKDPYPPGLDQACLAALDSPRLLRVEFSRGIALRARRYAYSYSLGNYDAVHLASAVEAGADVLMTWDKDLKRVRLVDGVWVHEPYDIGDATLFGT